MQTEPLTNRTVYTPRDPEGWFDILRAGEHPQYHGGRHLVQVVNAEDMQRLVTQWEADGKPEFLIDPDHFSLDNDKSSAAYGWGIGLRIDNAGFLQALPRWTADGDKAVAGGAFRNASIVIDCEALPGQPNGAGKDPNQPLRIKPTKLQSVALTNKPNITGLRFITNRRQVSDETLTTKPTTTNEMNLAQFALMMGLAETATESQVRETFAAIKNRADKADTAQASADLAEFKDYLPAGSEAMFTASLIANREPTLATLRNMKAAAPAAAAGQQQTVTTSQQNAGAGFHTPNRAAGAERAAGQQGAETGGQKLTEAEKHKLQGELIASIRNTNPRGSITEHMRAARCQKPELFT